MRRRACWLRRWREPPALSAAAPPPAKPTCPAPTGVQVNKAKQAALNDSATGGQCRRAGSADAGAGGPCQLRKDAKRSCPEQFTRPRGRCSLTVSLLKTALAEENDALHTAQADLKQRQTKTIPTAAAKRAGSPAQSTDRTAHRSGSAGDGSPRTCRHPGCGAGHWKPDGLRSNRAAQNIRRSSEQVTRLLARRKAPHRRRPERPAPQPEGTGRSLEAADSWDALDARWQWVNVASTAGGT